MNENNQNTGWKDFLMGNFYVSENQKKTKKMSKTKYNRRCLSESMTHFYKISCLAVQELKIHMPLK